MYCTTQYNVTAVAIDGDRLTDVDRAWPAQSYYKGAIAAINRPTYVNAKPQAKAWSAMQCFLYRPCRQKDGHTQNGNSIDRGAPPLIGAKQAIDGEEPAERVPRISRSGFLQFEIDRAAMPGSADVGRKHHGWRNKIKQFTLSSFCCVVLIQYYRFD